MSDVAEHLSKAFSIMGATKPGDEVSCKRCQIKFTRPFWFFYGLCDKCFALFDEARYGKSLLDVDEWIVGQAVRT